jgi:phosphoglycerate dehydrogenase-like enzyme
MLKPFEVDLVAFSRSGSGDTFSISDLDHHLPTLDVVILILPLTSESHHLMNADRLARMKTGSTLINVARGGIVDTDALVEELNRLRISAALDVTDPEPLPQGHPLWSAPNCIVVPHVGGDSTAFEPLGKRLVEEQLPRFAFGEPLVNVVNSFT